MTSSDWDKLLLTSADPNVASDRLVQLEKSGALRRMPPEGRIGLVRILGYCHFLYHFLCRHPEDAAVCGQSPAPRDVTECGDVEAVRRFKYRELLKLCCLDMAGTWDTLEMITALSEMAEAILACLWETCFADEEERQRRPCVLALGKLGARELNFSSDVDLIFVATDPDSDEEIGAMTIAEDSSRLGHYIRAWVNLLEERTAEGFLYRVDLRLRPWGEAGPLLLGPEAMENYYAANAEPWERLVLLRARPIAGYRRYGRELLRRLNPFIYLRTLGSDDVRRFAAMKKSLGRRRERSGSWDIKTGAGGIRDLEFSTQVLQIVQGAHHRDLRVTQTLSAIDALACIGVIPAEEGKKMSSAYRYLRLVENRLQMKNEQQTHRLPADVAERRLLARSIHPDSDDPVADFEERLEWSRKVAAAAFNRVLPDDPETEQGSA